MIRRDLCLLLALALVGATLVWVTRPEPQPEGSAALAPASEVPAERSTVDKVIASVTSIKAENSLLVGPSSDATPRVGEAVTSRLLPALVSVFAHAVDQSPDRLPQSGTGMVVSAEGHVLCPYELVPGAAAIRVRLADGTVEAARVLAVDRALSLALLQIPRNDLTPVQWVPSAQADRLERILVVGRGTSGGEWFCSALLSAPESGLVGTESAAPSDRLVVFDAPQAMGSGAVVADFRGQVVGLVRMEQPPGSATRYLVSPARMVESSFQQMLTQGRPARVQLGLAIQMLDRDTARSINFDKPAGVLVGDVLAEQAAALAGILPGDVILSAGGFRTASPRELRAILGHAPVDRPLPLEIWRGGETLTIVVQPAAAQAPYSSDAGTVDPFPGDSILKALSVRPAVGGGVEVAEFRPDQVVASASLLPGDLILEAAGVPLDGVESFPAAVEASRTGNLVRLRVESAGMRRYLILKRL